MVQRLIAVLALIGVIGAGGYYYATQETQEVSGYTEYDRSVCWVQTPDAGGRFESGDIIAVEALEHEWTATERVLTPFPNDMRTTIHQTKGWTEAAGNSLAANKKNHVIDCVTDPTNIVFRGE